MRKLITLMTLTILLLPLSSRAIEKGGVTMPDQLLTSSETLILNGVGIRSKFVFDLYVAGLYLKEKNSDATAIIQSTDPMAIRLHIISSKITSEKMSKATRKGFDKSTAKNTAAITKEIDQFIAAFSDPIQEGDIFEFVNIAEKGVVVTKNGTEKFTVSSPEFKTALFGIWLSENPAQAKLKNAMLGK